MHTEWDDIIINIPQQLNQYLPVLKITKKHYLVQFLWYQEAELIILHESLFKKVHFLLVSRERIVLKGSWRLRKTIIPITNNSAFYLVEDKCNSVINVIITSEISSVLLPSKGDVTIGGGTEEPGVHLKKIKRSSLKRKGQAIKVIGLRIY